MTPLELVLTKIPAAELARRLCIEPQAISQWKGSPIPVKRVLAIEAITGIPRHELRPDVYPEPQPEGSETISGAGNGPLAGRAPK